MSEDGIEDLASLGRREGGWDLRVAFVERRQLWWWNAWRPATSTEMYGFADSKAAAWRAMDEAIRNARLSDQLAERRHRHPDGTA